MGRNTLQSGVHGVAVTNPLTSADGEQFIATASTLTYNAAHAPIGRMAVVTTAAAASGNFRQSGLSFTQGVFELYLKFIGSVPASDMHLINVRTAGTTRCASLHSNGAKKLRLSDASGTTGVWTAPTAFDPDIWYRIVLGVAAGASSTGTLKCDYYRCGTELAFADTESVFEAGYAAVGSANTGGAVTYDDIVIGKYSAVAVQMALAMPNYELGTLTYPTRWKPTPAATSKPLYVRSNAGGWVLTGSDVSKPHALGDGSDSTYYASPGATTSEAVQVEMAPLATGSIVKLTYRAWLPSGSTATAVRVRLMQGATEIASQVRSTTDPDPLTATPKTFTMELSSGQAALITDRATLRVQVDGNAA